MVILKKGKNYNFFMRKLGCLIMPIIVQYSKLYNFNSMEIFGFLSLICFLVVYFTFE